MKKVVLAATFVVLTSVCYAQSITGYVDHAAYNAYTSMGSGPSSADTLATLNISTHDQIVFMYEHQQVVTMQSTAGAFSSSHTTATESVCDINAVSNDGNGIKIALNKKPSAGFSKVYLKQGDKKHKLSGIRDAKKEYTLTSENIK